MQLRRWLLGLGLGCLVAVSSNGIQAEEKKAEVPPVKKATPETKKDTPEAKKDTPEPKKNPPEKKNNAIVPVAKKDKFWVDRHENFVKRAKMGDVDVAFIGDSITQGWEGAGKDAWKENFAPLKAANFGIGGDQTQHVLWRITEGKELEPIQPKAAVIMIGTNNAGGYTAAEIAQGVQEIIKELNKQKPEMKILLLGVFPRNGKGKDLKDATKVQEGEFHPKIKDINAILAKFESKNVKYLDIGSKFLDKDGSLTKEIMPDFLHLSPKGYQIWAEAIKAPLADLLKK